MFDGKMLRELAGIPIRRIDFANSALALAEPDPLTLANLTTKSLTLVIGDGIRSELVRVFCHPREGGGPRGANAGRPAVPSPAGPCGPFQGSRGDDCRHRLRHAGPAIVMSRRNLRMSHAPVGQRSAHRPQCRQTSSSFTKIRPVFSESIGRAHV